MIELYYRMKNLPPPLHVSGDFELYEACFGMFLQEHIGETLPVVFDLISMKEDPADNNKKKLWYGHRLL